MGMIDPEEFDNSEVTKTDAEVVEAPAPESGEPVVESSSEDEN